MQKIRLILSTSVLATILIGFSIVLANTTDAPRVTKPESVTGFQAGVGLLLRRSDYADDADLKAKLSDVLDRLVEDHVNSLNIVWLVYTAGTTASSVEKGADTPADDSLAAVATMARERGFFVTLRPVLDEMSIVAEGKGDWRGTIRPDNVDGWFASYGSLLGEYATLAEHSKASSFIIGSEFDSMEQYADRWRSVIDGVRAHFSGTVSYASNQGVSHEMPWDALDYIGVDAFFPLDTPAKGVSARDMLHASQKWVQLVADAQAQIGKPVVLTEVGSASQQNGHKESWKWDHQTPVSLSDQRNFYAAMCAAWKPSVTGMYWWVVSLNPAVDPSGDGGFDPTGKPSEKELSKCFA